MTKAIDLEFEREQMDLSNRLTERDLEEFDEIQEACEVGDVRRQVQNSQHRSEREFYRH